MFGTVSRESAREIESWGARCAIQRPRALSVARNTPRHYPAGPQGAENSPNGGLSARAVAKKNFATVV